VLGLVAAALGRGRTDPIEDLVALRFGVRGDRPGEVVRDFHTLSSLFNDEGKFAPGEGRLPTASGGHRSTATSTQVTERFYLADACFVAGLEGDAAMLSQLDGALRRPVFPIYLGRRSCPPDAPVRLGVHDGDLLQVLGSIPWQGGVGIARAGALVHCEAVIEDSEGDRELVDEVRSFDSIHRSYGRRRVRHHYLEVPNPVGSARTEANDHDPIALLEEP
jgi:CRISPR system Cascade subunit CasD